MSQHEYLYPRLLASVCDGVTESASSCHHHACMACIILHL